MQVLSYSPKVNVYVALTRDGSVSYRDLSPDVVQCTVARKTDAASTFSVRLQNVDNKYNGMFMPFDRVSISCVKDKKQQLIVGYVTKLPAYTLYGADVTLDGACPIYRLEQLYWDPKLLESYELLGYNNRESGWDGVIYNLLTEVGGYSLDQIEIGDMPQEIIDWARELYQDNLDSSNQLKSMADEFYKILQTHGPTISVTSGETSAATEETSSGGGVYSFVGSNNAEITWNFCKANGFSDAAAAATIGNAAIESGSPELPTDVYQDGGPAYGMFQWEDTSTLESIAAKMGTKRSDLKAQLACMLETLPGAFDVYTGKTYTYDNGTVTWWPDKVSFKQWKTWTDIAKATECFMRVWERPSSPHLERRIDAAKSAYAQFSGKTSATKSTGRK